MKKISELKVWKIEVTKPFTIQEVEYIISSTNFMAMREGAEAYFELCRIDVKKDYSVIYVLCEEDNLKFLHKFIQTKYPNLTYKIEETDFHSLQSLP